MTISFELFATGAVSADALWAVVSDPARLPEWTDASVASGPDRPLAEGDTVAVTVDGRPSDWTVITAADRLVELRGTVPDGVLGFGARVVPDPRGSRLILACSLEPAGSRMRARLLTVPRLRSRCDRWAAAALHVARGTG